MNEYSWSQCRPLRLTRGYGGVPERTNGAVLKTAGARKGARGFESHPRRLIEPKPPSVAGFGVSRSALSRLSSYRLKPLETARGWRRLAQSTGAGNRAKGGRA